MTRIIFFVRGSEQSGPFLCSYFINIINNSNCPRLKPWPPLLTKILGYPESFRGPTDFFKRLQPQKKTTAEETDFLPKAFEEAIGIASGKMVISAGLKPRSLLLIENMSFDIL